MNFKAMLAASLVMSMTATAFAQGAGRTRTRVQPAVTKQIVAAAQNPNRIALDIAPLMGAGLGASYERTIYSRWTVGSHVAYYTIDATEKDLNVKNRITMFGAHGRYFFEDRTDVNSIYLLGGATLANIDAEAKFSTSSRSGSASGTSIGPVLGAGYQIVPKSWHQSMIINLGGIFGHGYAVATRAQSINYGPTQINETKAAEAFFLEAKLGFKF